MSEMNRLMNQAIKERLVSFRAKILQYKDENDLRYSDLGDECNVCGKTIQSIVTGKTSGKATTIMKIEVALGIKL